MADDQKKIVPIDYTHRDFRSIRSDLMEIVERFYPDTLQDFSEASFGSIMLDAVSYVGDQLSFYLDYNVNEAFLDTAYQYSNVVRHGRVLGYKDPGRRSTFGQVALFVLVPASSTAIGPDTRYIPILKKGSRFSSKNALNFVLTENVDFNNPKYPRVVARVDDSSGAPTYYAIKAYGNVVSGFFTQDSITVGAYQRFKKVKIASQNVSEIISVFDTQGNEYFEVDYLSQDMVFKEVANDNYKNDNVPSVIKPYIVSRKFVVERDRYNTYLQFGSGKSGDSNVVSDPQSVALDVFGKSYVTDTTFDPTKLSNNENLGIVPSNTTLTVVYRMTNPANSNAAASSINQVGSALFDFKDKDQLTNSVVQTVMNSLEVNNETPIAGDVRNPTTTEVKRRIYDTFPTQNRAVTQADYENIVQRMPGKFGSVKRVSVQRDPNSLQRNLNMYVVSEDNYGKLIKTNDTIKKNIKTWINNYRMMNDTVDIADPYIVNIGIDFIVTPDAGADKYETLDRCIAALSENYKLPFYIGEPLYISEIYKILKEVEGVLDVVKAKVVNNRGGNYSSTVLEINKNTSPDGSYLMVPNNVVLELKFPQADIKGKIR